MAYGVAADVEKLVWGNTRTPTPPAVTTALEVATDRINDELNLDEDLAGDDLPTKFNRVATLLAAGTLQESRNPEVKAQNSIIGEKMLKGLKDQTTEESRGESYHVQIMDDE